MRAGRHHVRNAFPVFEDVSAWGAQAVRLQPASLVGGELRSQQRRGPLLPPRNVIAHVSMVAILNTETAHICSCRTDASTLLLTVHETKESHRARPCNMQLQKGFTTGRQPPSHQPSDALDLVAAIEMAAHQAVSRMAHNSTATA